MFVITADQDASRRSGDRVEVILGELTTLIRDRDLADGVALPFERTVGDEVQGVLTDAAAALRLALHLQRHQEWSVGIGIGPVDLPLAESARASSGAAFVRAREAVERARGKSVPVPFALEAGSTPRSEQTESLLQLLAAVVRRRTAQGWEVVDLLSQGAATRREAAASLGISAQAVSQRLRVAMWTEEEQVHPLAERLLAGLDAGGS
ncbi:MAG: hypothetical protein JJE50_02625 [Actinomycetales bacterium]|nr:hypothetical protein [Actinomycetales bacterium]